MARVGVVFSSGFFGFFAHGGFLSALKDLGIVSSGFGGASSGAIVAAMAACLMSEDEIKACLFGLEKSDFWDPDPFPLILKGLVKGLRGYSGYLKGEGFARLLEKIPVKNIQDCPVPLLVVATNLTTRREEVITRGGLIKGVQASGAVPMLFKPVEIGGALYVDGGVVNKAPVQALADLIKPEKIIVHFIASDNLGRGTTAFLKRKMTPWHIQHLAVNIARQRAYERQCDMVRERGIEIVQVETSAPAVGPNSLEKGPLAYRKAREEALGILSGRHF